MHSFAGVFESCCSVEVGWSYTGNRRGHQTSCNNQNDEGCSSPTSTSATKQSERVCACTHRLNYFQFGVSENTCVGSLLLHTKCIQLMLLILTICWFLLRIQQIQRPFFTLKHFDVAVGKQWCLICIKLPFHRPIHSKYFDVAGYTGVTNNINYGPVPLRWARALLLCCEEQD